MREEARDLARDRWPQILMAAGITENHLRKNHHGPCPVCGGTDRFRFDNKDGSGSYYCNQCGPGDGFSLLMKHMQFSFKQAAEYVREQIGNIPVDAKPAASPSAKQEESDEAKAARLRNVWKKSTPIQKGDPVWTYLTHTRQLPIDGSMLHVVRYHPSLPYVDFASRKMLGYFPAMILLIQDNAREVIGMHKTYLTRDGRKADVSEPKKTEKIRKLSGGAVQLFKPGKKLAVTEGFENALAVRALKGLPVWSCLNKVLLSQFVVPDGVEELYIYGDNDAPDLKGRRAGQEAAAELAERVIKEGRKAKIILPTSAGIDFADIWVAHLARKKAA